MTVLKGYSVEDINEESNRNISFHGITIYPDQRRILSAENEIFLSHYEFDMLLLLVKHPGWVFTKEQIYEAVWDDIPVSVDWDTNSIRKLKKEPSVRAAPSRFYTLDSSKEYRSSI